MLYPHPKGHPGLYVSGGIPGGLHETAGDDDFHPNLALDFMAPGGTPVIASEDGELVKFSGHDPATGVHDGDIFGWTMYLRTAGGVLYFDTHLGERYGKVGLHVKAGTIIGLVGHWPGDPGRSHTHRGITMPNGSKLDAEHRICQVARGPHVKGHPL